jgi:ubiquinone/menaquinone biosynthesis C-methylase UbiE
MALCSTSDLEWQVYAKLDYAASHDLAHGSAEWKVLKRHINQFGASGTLQCVEIGCGAGRLTSALAGDFERVHALDVSQERIEQARCVCDSAVVEFHLVRQAAIPAPPDSTDLCISTHVFQHISDRRVTHAYLTESFRVLRPGACLLIHLPMIGAHGFTGDLLEAFRRLTKETIKRAALPITRLAMRAGLVPWRIDHYTLFSFVRVRRELEEIGFHDVELRIVRDHSYVLAHKAICNS